VLVSNFGGGRLRAVTHYGISEADCRAAVDAFRRVDREADRATLARSASGHA
jgi:hypothetical protein